MMSPYFQSQADTATGAPVRWRVIGWRESVFQACPGEPWRAAGCCDKCGASIRYVVTLKSTDGRVLDVGQDCAVTLKGGPELAEIRNAEAAYQREQYLKSPEYAAERERERARKASLEAAKARAEEEFALELFGLRAILASPNTTRWEQDHATARQDRILAGHGDYDTDAEVAATLALGAAKAFLPNSGHAGTVGEKIERRAMFEAMIPIETAYGTNYINRFRANDGSVLVWWSKACELRRSDLGEWVTIRGTVKGHTDFRGEAQTTLVRCKTTQ